MHERGIQRLVVVQGEEAVGVLSASDLVPVVQRYEAGLS
jgi:CBS domain-containing protein